MKSTASYRWNAISERVAINLRVRRPFIIELRHGESSIGNLDPPFRA